MKPILIVLFSAAAALAQIRAGVARRDITPREPVPMWGYGARHDALSRGIVDPLYAEILVLETAGGRKLAIVGCDMGRSPAERSLQEIRRRVRERTGIEWSFIAGSHTHHGPVLELTDEPGKGKGKFDATLRYYRELENSIVEGIVEANGNLAAARLGTGAVKLDGFNRNRHTKLEPKPVDRDLTVLRVDREDGKMLALLVNFTAHPTMLPAERLEFSADYVGAMKSSVAKSTGAHVLFMQGASGDQSVNDFTRGGYQKFGEALGAEVVKLAGGIQTEVPAKTSLEWREDRFRFNSRTDFGNPIIRMMFSEAFFSELVPNYVDEYSEGIRPRLSVAVLNGDIAMVGVSGEFFANHAIRLKERARVKQLFFFGYANGYHQYFPTIEAVSEGGYGADNQVSPVAVGAGELIMNSALEWIYRLRGKIK